MNLIIKIYDYLSGRSKILYISLVALLSVFVYLVFNLNYSEDISDFLPLEPAEQEALAIYQNISGANRLYILFSNPDDADLTVQAIDHFAEAVQLADSLGWCRDLTTQFDMEQIQQVTNFVYDNIPYLLTSEDYARMDSLLSRPDYIPEQMRRNLEMLMFPSGGMMTANLSKDPLGLFSPVLTHLQSANQQMSFEMYDGYIFTPDMSRAVVMMSSPFGNSETENNSKMLDILHQSIDSMQHKYPSIEAHVVGGPEIAVGNASRIKKDSILAVSLSVVLIVLLAAYSIGSFKNILLIFLSIGWGWLFALSGVALFSNQVSIIVIGISSVILGIAVNYPLHMIVHLSHVGTMRRTIREIALPLIIGNITTVGAFLTLIPLQSVALRDLGLFASLLLVGTIIFVLIYLPHLLKASSTTEHRSKLLDRVASLSPERHRGVVVAVVIITLLLSIFSFRTEFDSNMANINYMDEKQREDMAYFQGLLSDAATSTSQSVYVVSSGASFDQALQQNSLVTPRIDSLVAAGVVHNYSGVSQFLSSRDEQQQRLDMWRDFIRCHHTAFTQTLPLIAEQMGFSSGAFADFYALLSSSEMLSPKDIAYFEPLTNLVLSQNVTQLKDTERAYIINVVNVEAEDVDSVKSLFDGSFDVQGMNSALSNNLSDNFQYIGWACSIIVFFFLWFSFGRVELAIISFLPMAISWIWILGIMAILGIKFNIVNIILATFIFGQGDDYTIFMTEGCQFEYTHRRKILSSYKSSILQSALIMFVGIGTLIISKHPAMRSLAEVTIVGMFSVVLMAYMIPPLLFKWITTKDGLVRRHPITLRTLLVGYPSDAVEQVQGRYIYKGSAIMRSVRSNLKHFAPRLAELPVSDNGDILISDSGYGEQALLVALMYPERRVVATLGDEHRCRIAEVAALDFVSNIEFKY